MHHCTGSGCMQFLCMEERKLLDLEWERLLEDSDSERHEDGTFKLCGVDITCFQLSAQQTAGLLANFDDECHFPTIDTEFEQVWYSTTLSTLCQLLPRAIYLPRVTTVVAASTVNSTVSQATSQCVISPPIASTSTRVYSSPKGDEAVKAARARKIPTKAKDQTDWAVRV